MITKYHEPILKVISEKGALGVNQIAKETDIPASTVQKYLSTQQNYFKKNDERKWDLPEKVNSDISDNALTHSVNSVESTLLLMQSQLQEALNSIQTVTYPLSVIKRGIQTKPAPVANTRINSKLEIILEKTDKLPDIIKKRKQFITDELYDILINTDWLGLTLDMGDKYVEDVINPALYELLSGSKTELDEDALITIKEYQTE